MDYRLEAEYWQKEANDYYFKSLEQKDDRDIQLFYGMGIAFERVAAHYRRLAEEQENGLSSGS